MEELITLAGIPKEHIGWASREPNHESHRTTPSDIKEAGFVHKIDKTEVESKLLVIGSACFRLNVQPSNTDERLCGFQ